MRAYLTESLPQDLDTQHQFRLLITAFLSLFFSVLVVHQFLPGAQPWFDLLLHGLVIATTYCFAAALVGLLLYASRRFIQSGKLRVWHIWMVSFLVFNLGFFIELPVSDLRALLHKDMSQIPVYVHYLRLTPLWFVFTFVLIHIYLKQSLQNELNELKSINEFLDERAPIEPSAKSLPMEPVILHDDISHISVDDHYCYIFYFTANGWQKTDVGKPLWELIEMLPEDFLRVHRSHVVNPAHVSGVQREGRNTVIEMADGDKLPVSRTRKVEVLARLHGVG